MDQNDSGLSEGGQDALVDSGPDVDGAGPEPADANDDGRSYEDVEVTDSAGSDAPPDAPSEYVSCAETTTCATALQLPAIVGDVLGLPQSTAYTTGAHSEWFVVDVGEYYATSSALSARISLISPAAKQFTYDAYLPNAGGSAECSTITGGPNAYGILNLSWPTSQTLGIRSDRQLTIHVYRAQDGMDGAVSAADADSMDAASGNTLLCKSTDEWQLQIDGGF